MRKILLGLVLLVMSSFTSQAQDEERIRMQQEYQRIKPVIDREWCSSWASVGDDRCFWDRSGRKKSSSNERVCTTEKIGNTLETVCRDK
jgi:hypothetical protein